MKLLKIENNCGYYLGADEELYPMDKLDKEGLLRLVNWTLQEESVCFDECDERLLKNQAHLIIYSNVYRKLKALQDRRDEFLDESARLFLEDYEKYRADGFDN